MSPAASPVRRVGSPRSPPASGGLLFWQAARLLRRLTLRCRLAGMDVCEFAPTRDPQDHTALVITRLLMIAMGAAARRQA